MFSPTRESPPIDTPFWQFFVTIATTPQSILCDVKNDVHNQHLFIYHISSS